MKTTLRALALAALASVAAIPWLKIPHVFVAPGETVSAATRTGASVCGRVTHGGAPVAGARVRLGMPAPRLMTPLDFRATTDSEGRFELEGVPAGRARLAVFVDHLAPLIQSVDVTPGLDLALDLEAGVALEGRLVSNSIPVAGARVALWLPGAGALLDGRPLRETVSDADGRYRLDGLDADQPFRLVILGEKTRPYEKAFRLVTDVPDSLDLDTGLSSAGRIVTTSGAPVEGATVSASQGEAYPRAATSGANGDVDLGGLASRRVTIRVAKAGYAPGRLDLSAPGEAWTLVLRRTGGVAGRAPHAAVLELERDGTVYRRELGADGEFRWEGLPPGPVVAKAVDAAGRLRVSQQVVIPEGGLAEGIILEP